MSQGAGKTTFLRYLTLAYLDRGVFEKSKLGESRIPAYIHLPALPKENIDIISAVAGPVVARTDARARLFFQRLFETGNVVLLLDSLDEVTSDHRSAVVKAVNDFCCTYPNTRVVLSCRTADYHQVFESFAEVEIARLDSEAVTAIVRGWFSYDPKRAEKLLAMLRSDSAVASLTETPLLLGLLSIQYRNDLALPKRKTELYRRCVDALIRDWDASRNFRRDTKYSQLSDDRKETLFEYIAGANGRLEISYEFSEAALVSTVSEVLSRFGVDGKEARGIIDEIESHHGIIEKCSAESYQFSHGTMHEYFLARHLVETRSEMECLKKHYDDDRWHTVIGFMCAILNDPSPLLQFLVAQSSTKSFKNYPAFGKRLSHLLLLYRCMTMGVAISPDLRAAICDHLIESQIHLMVKLRSDSVVPYAVRLPIGVRQTLVTYGNTRPRTTIDRLLLPYRSLMNEVSISPLADYADKVVKISGNEDYFDGVDLYARIGIMSCLLAPIADMKSQEFFDRMLIFSLQLREHKADSIRQLILESINVHRSKYPMMEPSGPISPG